MCCSAIAISSSSRRASSASAAAPCWLNTSQSVVEAHGRWRYRRARLRGSPPALIFGAGCRSDMWVLCSDVSARLWFAGCASLFADYLRDPVCDVIVVAWTNKSSRDRPLSCGVDVRVGNVVEDILGNKGLDVGCGVRWPCPCTRYKALGSCDNATRHALTSPSGTSKPVLATMELARFLDSVGDDNTSSFPSQIASNSFRSCSVRLASHPRT